MAPIQHVCERKMRRKPTKILKKKNHEFNESGKKTIKLVNPVIMQCPHPHHHHHHHHHHHDHHHHHHHHHSQITNSILATGCLMPGRGIPEKIHTNTCMKMVTLLGIQRIDSFFQMVFTGLLIRLLPQNQLKFSPCILKKYPGSISKSNQV